MGKSLSPGKTGTATDMVYTPVQLAKDIIAHLKPLGHVLDPCRGGGAFYDNFPGEKSYCEITEGLDFMQYSGPKVDHIITNPPWSLCREFLLKGFQYADKISFLITVNHAFTKARIRDMKEAGFYISEILLVETPKANWPQSGFQLGVITWTRGSGQTSIIYNAQEGTLQ